MIYQKSSGSVWNVALVAVALFSAVIIITGLISPSEITVIASQTAN